MEDWRGLCRTCGITINEKIARAKLFEELNYPLVSLIEDITDMWMESDRSLPEYICNKCKSLLEEVVEFRVSCLDTHKKLLEAKRRAIKNLKDEHNLCEDIENVNNTDCVELQQANSKSNCEAVEIQCPEPSKSSAKANRINRRSSSKKPNTWICEQCGGEFKCSTYLKLHMLRHTGKKEFECDICKRRYYTHNEMIRHKILHSKARPYSCRFCDKSFRGTSSKAVHERTHTNERPFACQYCEKTFTSTSVRRMHERVHINNRKYHCEPCDQWFQRSSHLSLHQRTKLHKSKIINT
ncbi:zinc finger protein 436 [Drosophila grimshawi]|uniref:GH22379 n=1 Tax=Drosophila grimshawi TaxID=7222 RepID=B4JYX5_DROGR|nr:zinc finger protein 436 [Drosophila grimshawi]XP_043071678.1 zinc finger protein 436 [Drosophila grimshawi]EDV98590.1 GH22379 [Drosophila grimshawi]